MPLLGFLAPPLPVSRGYSPQLPPTLELSPHMVKHSFLAVCYESSKKLFRFAGQHFPGVIPNWEEFDASL